jgi:hypothetical protein
MRRLDATLAAAAVATSVLTCASPASAAPGVVRIYGPDGQVRTYADPEAGRCYRGTGADSALVNQTEGTILVFPDSGCRTRIYDPVEPGETKSGNISSFKPLD